jgi:hypothetical protein
MIAREAASVPLCPQISTQVATGDGPANRVQGPEAIFDDRTTR